MLFLLLVYLIYLRRNRIKAEEWLEVHKDVLFGSTWGKMTEVEILEALVKNKNMADTLASPQAQQDAAAAARGVPDHTWLSGSDEKRDDESGSDGDDGDKQDKKLLAGNLKKGGKERDDQPKRSHQLTVVEEAGDAREARGSSQLQPRSPPKDNKRFESDDDRAQ